jgi:hypothetical protein
MKLLLNPNSDSPVPTALRRLALVAWSWYNHFGYMLRSISAIIPMPSLLTIYNTGTRRLNKPLTMYDTGSRFRLLYLHKAFFLHRGDMLLEMTIILYNELGQWFD